MKKINEDISKQASQLFDCAKKRPSMGKRYVMLAKKMAMRFNVKIPKELKKRYCHHCYSYFTPKNCRTRIKRGTRVVYCLKCRHYNRTKLA